MNNMEQRALVTLQHLAKCRIADRADNSKGVWIDSDDEQLSSYALIESHELFEALLLLNVGLAVRTVSRNAIESFYSKVFQHFFLSLLPSAGVIEPKSEYVEHSLESKELRRSFQRFSETLEKGMRGEGVLSQVIHLANPTSLRSSYEKILLLQLGIIQDSGIRVYLDAVKFWTSGAWENVMKEIPEPSRIVRAEDSQDQRAATILYGFMRFVGFQSEIKTTLDKLDRASDYADATRFAERIRDIFNWRMDFRSREAFRRFDQIRELVILNSVAELPAGARSQVRSRLEDTFDEVFGLEKA